MTPEDTAVEEEACIRRAEEWTREQGIEVAVIDLRSPEEKQIAALTERLARLEQTPHDLRAALRCQQEASEGLAHLYELLTAKVATLEGLLLTVATAVDQLGPGAIGLGVSKDVSAAIERLREAQGKEP